MSQAQFHVIYGGHEYKKADTTNYTPYIGRIVLHLDTFLYLADGYKWNRMQSKEEVGVIDIPTGNDGWISGTYDFEHRYADPHVQITLEKTADFTANTLTITEITNTSFSWRFLADSRSFKIHYIIKERR